MQIIQSLIGSKFYISEIHSGSGVLRLSIGLESEPKVTIIFRHVRAYIQFKESDMFEAIERASLEPVITSQFSNGGVFRLNTAVITSGVLTERLAEESPDYYLVLTPDECVEVICFSPPILE